MSQKRIDNAITELSTLVNDGGYLREDDGDRFIQQMINESTFLPMIRPKLMNRPNENIVRAGFKSTILRPARQALGNRALTNAEKTGLDFNSVNLQAVELIGEVPLTYEVLEDNIEKEGFQDFVLREIARSLAADLEYLGFQGDAAAVAPFPAFDPSGLIVANDGWLKLVPAANVIAPTVAGTSLNFTEITNLLNNLGTQYKRNKQDLLVIMNPLQEELYAHSLSVNGNGIGEMAVLTGQVRPAAGMTIVLSPFMPEDKVLLCHKDNFVMGVHRQVSLEFEREAKERIVDTVFTVRADYQYVDPDGVILLEGLGTAL